MTFLTHGMRATRRDVIAGGLSLSALSGFSVQAATAPEASTVYGKVRGFTDGSIKVFKGIPYGGDTALRRFQPSVPPTPWAGTLDTLGFGPRAPQPPGRPSNFAPNRPTEEPVSEDCLKLNVWTPALRDGGKRPVLVWIHGGGYINYSANSDMYDGTRLAAKGDAVVVSMNHRLNLFGFLYLGQWAQEPEAAFADSGNVGMLDLILALEWVRDNIAEFGGDPNNVTIFGQSGGGAKCSVLMAMPKARGLFHKVWTMSGQQVTGTPKDMVTRNAEGVFRLAGLVPGDIEGLKKLSMEDLIKVARGSPYYGPVTDGRSLPRDPFEPDATPLSRDIPLVMGNTRTETTLLLGAADPSLFTLSWDDLPGKIKSHLGGYIKDISPETVIATFRKLYPDYGPSDLFFVASTVLRSWRAQVRQADRRAEQPKGAAPTWVYLFDWFSPVADGKWKAPHTLDIPFVFDNVQLAASMTGGGAEAQRLADRVSDSFLAFARTGNPNTPSLPHWPAYTVPKRQTLLFDNKSTVASDPRGADRRFAETIPYRQPGT
jgi:para-nitrobenzyl esterase